MKSKTYDNGLRLIVEPMQSVRTIATGIWVGVGSNYETSDINGLSHFTEHMLFKGTKSLSSFEISDKFESLGAQVNAFTGKENTCYYVKSVDEYASQCFDLLADIFFNSIFDSEELKKEQKVVLEEINMNEDSPEDLCYDLIAQTQYPNNAIGQTILGSKDNVMSFDRNHIIDFMSKFYSAPNIVISMAGNITFEEADKMVKSKFLPFSQAGKRIIDPKGEYIAPISYFATKTKDFEQSNIAISFPSVAFNSPEYYTQAVMSVVLGGGMSSRLFQRIREQLSLAYSVYCAPSGYINSGSFNIFCNFSPKNVEKTVTTIKEEILNIMNNGITEKEFSRAKAQLKSTIVFGQENVQTVMSTLGKMLCNADELYDYNQKIEAINNVSISDVQNIMKEIFDFNKASLAYVGKPTKANFSALLKN